MILSLCHSISLTITFWGIFEFYVNSRRKARSLPALALLACCMLLTKPYESMWRKILSCSVVLRDKRYAKFVIYHAIIKQGAVYGNLLLCFEQIFTLSVRNQRDEISYVEEAEEVDLKEWHNFGLTLVSVKINGNWCHHHQDSEQA